MTNVRRTTQSFLGSHSVRPSTSTKKLQGVNDPGAIVDIAKEAGFTISAEELQSAQVELSDEQLDGAAGGHHGSFRTAGCV